MQKLFIGLSLLLALGGCAQSYEKTSSENPPRDSTTQSSKQGGYTSYY
jgi:hypothetical protein